MAGFRGGIIAFEPFVTGAEIQPALSKDLENDDPARFTILRSKKHYRKQAFLRAGDAINFTEHAVTLEFGYGIEASAPTSPKVSVDKKAHPKVKIKPKVKAEPKVEVKSSAPRPDPFNTFGGDSSRDSAEASSSPDDDPGMPIKSPVRRQTTPDKDLFSTARTTGVVEETPAKPKPAVVDMIDGETDDDGDLDMSTHPIADSLPVPTEVVVLPSTLTPALSLPLPSPAVGLPSVSFLNGTEDASKDLDDVQIRTSIEQAAFSSPNEEQQSGTNEPGPDVPGLVFDGGGSQDEPGDEVFGGNKYVDPDRIMRKAKKRKTTEPVPDEQPVSSASSTNHKRLRGTQNTSNVTGTKSRRVSGVTVPSPSPALSDKSELYAGIPPRLLFSNSVVEHKPELMKFLRRQNATQTDDPAEGASDVLVVGVGDVKTTAKLLMSLVLDRQIVTDDWVIESHKAGHLLNTKSFSPPTLFATRQTARNTLWADKTVYFTQAARKGYGSGFDSIMTILKHAGVREVASGPAREIKDNPDAIVIGIESKDNDVGALAKYDIRCFKKDIISASIIQNELNLDDDEFVIRTEEAVTPKPNTGKKGKGK